MAGEAERVIGCESCTEWVGIRDYFLEGLVLDDWTTFFHVVNQRVLLAGIKVRIWDAKIVLDHKPLEAFLARPPSLIVDRTEGYLVPL